MTGPTDGPDTGERAEELYDAYVAAALRGDAPSPAEFLARHGADDPVLRDRLERVHGHQAGRRPAEGDLPFARLGRYRVLRRLGEGGMGAVFLGEDERLGRLVALKVLRPELQGSSTVAARFEREAQVVARLRHPAIVALHDVGEERGVRFLAMEYVEGEGLDETIARAGEDGRPLPVETCVRWAAQIAAALQSVHEAGVVHRDVKPSNVRITPRGDAVLLDFGVAAEEGSHRLTHTGRFLGTAGYASPEQLSGSAEPDARSDVWSLAAVLFESLAGTPPFDGASDADTVRRVLESEPPSLRRLRPSVPRDLATVLSVGLEKDPARRYASAAAFAEDLRAVLAARPVTARGAGMLRRASRAARRRPALSAAAALAVAGFTALAVTRAAERRALADEALQQARDGVDTFRRESAAARDAEQRLEWYEKRLECAYMTPEEDATLAATEAEVHASRRRREAAFHETLSHAARAESLGAGAAPADAVRAALYVERWREAGLRHDDDGAAFYRQLVLRLAPDGEGADQVAGHGSVRVACGAAGATARLFTFQLQSACRPDGEPRLVPVGVDAPDLALAGAWAFRLLDDHAPLLAGDLVTAVGGEGVSEDNWSALRARLVAGAPVEAHGRGAHGAVDLAPGARVRVTTQPLVWSGGEALGRDVPVPAGTALAVVRAPGFEEARVPVVVGPGGALRVEVTLDPAGTTPPGFVPVRGDRRPEVALRIRETEVTAAEYLEFLNDPATRTDVDRADALVRAPRSRVTAAQGGHWARGADGLWTLPDGWPAAWPAFGVSWDDADAYCRWWTRRAQARGERWRARLPTVEEWALVGGSSPQRDYVFGNRFRPKWVGSCFARPRAGPSPPASFPRDESCAGVFDTAGSLCEWLATWWDESAGSRRLAGGSWADPRPESFRIWGGQGLPPTAAGDELGFRFVIEPGDEDAPR